MDRAAFIGGESSKAAHEREEEEEEEEEARDYTWAYPVSACTAQKYINSLLPAVRPCSHMHGAYFVVLSKYQFIALV